MQAKVILQRVATVLQDEQFTRWTPAELRGWLSEALLELGRMVPSAFSRPVTIPLAAGAEQALPAEYDRILRALGNAPPPAGNREVPCSVTVVDKALLDASAPAWEMVPEKRRRSQVRHIMFDETDPRLFHVYPPNDGTGGLRALVAASPQEVAVSGDPNSIDSYDTEILLDDAYMGALTDFALYRAYSKDAQYAGSAQRAAAHFTQFQNALGIQLGADANLSINRKPGVAAAAPGVTAGA